MDPILQIAYSTMVALERVSGLPFLVLAAIVIAVAVVIGLLVGRRMFTDPATIPESVRKEPPQMQATDPATGEPGNSVLGHEFTDQLDDLHQRMGEIMTGLSGDDQALAAKISAARKALDGGAVDQAVALLNIAGTVASEAGRAFRDQAEQRLMGATLARLVAGDLEMAAQNIPAAAEHYRNAIETVPHGNVALLAECLNKHGTAMYRSRNGQAAAISFKRAIKLVERAKGTNHPDVATALNNLAMVLYAMGEFGAANPLYKRALKIDESALGPEAIAVGTDLNNLALLYKKQGRLKEAEPLMKRALAIKSVHFGPGHPSLVSGLRNYASVLRAVGRDKEAQLYETHANTTPPKHAPDDVVKPESSSR